VESGIWNHKSLLNIMKGGRSSSKGTLWRIRAGRDDDVHSGVKQGDDEHFCIVARGFICHKAVIYQFICAGLPKIYHHGRGQYSSGCALWFLVKAIKVMIISSLADTSKLLSLDILFGSTNH
jgi:hypothetical protein